MTWPFGRRSTSPGSPPAPAPRSPIDQIERMRSLLAFLLVGAFISMLPALILVAIPTNNKDIVTYMVGQLSGMATLALGFYFVNKVGADAADAKRAENTGKMAEAVIAAANAGGSPEKVGEAADKVAGAAAKKADEIKGEN